jgi:hypothetical protein
MTIEEIGLLIATIQVVLVIIQAYFAYRINKGRLNIEKYVGISEKAGLTLKPMTQYPNKEIIKLSNTGIAPIDEIEAKIDITISHKNSPDIPLHLEWECKTVLNPKENVVIFLYEKFDLVLEQNKLVATRTVEIPTGETDPISGEEIFIEDKVKDLKKVFSATINIEVKSKIYDSTKTIKKKFRLDYNYKPEVYGEQPEILEYEDNFKIQISELAGEWKA